MALVVMAVEAGVLALPYIPAMNPINFMASVLPSVLDDLTNQKRQGQDLAVLSVNPLLNKAAELKAQDMAKKGYFAHTSPDGKSPWYWFNLVGYKYEYAGENLAVDFDDSKDVANAWMNSPAHKANIVKYAYTEIGTGIATGTYEGRPTVFVAQIYAKPAAFGGFDQRPLKAMAEAIPTTAHRAIAVSTSKVMGAETTVNDRPIPVIAQTSSVPIVVDTTPARSYAKTNAFEAYVTSPRHLASFIFIILGILVALALLFKLFIRMDKRHPVLITNGLVAFVLILAVYVANNYIAGVKMAVTTSFASFQGEQIERNQ